MFVQRPTSHEAKGKQQKQTESLTAGSVSGDSTSALVKSSDSKQSSYVSTVSSRKRRTAIPEKPNYSLNLWSIMRNSIGKELSKIPMPVRIVSCPPPL